MMHRYTDINYVGIHTFVLCIVLNTNSHDTYSLYIPLISNLFHFLVSHLENNHVQREVETV